MLQKYLTMFFSQIAQKKNVDKSQTFYTHDFPNIQLLCKDLIQSIQCKFATKIKTYIGILARQNFRPQVRKKTIDYKKIKTTYRDTKVFPAGKTDTAGKEKVNAARQKCTFSISENLDLKQAYTQLLGFQ